MLIFGIVTFDDQPKGQITVILIYVINTLLIMITVTRIIIKIAVSIFKTYIYYTFI